MGGSSSRKGLRMKLKWRAFALVIVASCVIVLSVGAAQGAQSSRPTATWWIWVAGTTSHN
jgi:hypothetical protein